MCLHTKFDANRTIFGEIITFHRFSRWLPARSRDITMHVTQYLSLLRAVFAVVVVVNEADKVRPDVVVGGAVVGITTTRRYSTVHSPVSLIKVT